MITLRMVLKPQTFLKAYQQGQNIVLRFDAFELEMSVNDVSLMLNEIVDIEGNLAKLEVGHE